MGRKEKGAEELRYKIWFIVTLIFVVIAFIIFALITIFTSHRININIQIIMKDTRMMGLQGILNMKALLRELL